jgi:uncharacterized membrane protein YkoI
MSAVRARFPNATVTDVARENEDRKTIYEVSLMDAGRKVDVSATADGQIVAIEGALPETALPPAVTQALAAKYPGATYKLIEDVTTKEAGAERLAYYEVLVQTADTKLIEVEIAADGKILKETNKKSAEP